MTKKLRVTSVVAEGIMRVSRTMGNSRFKFIAL